MAYLVYTGDDALSGAAGLEAILGDGGSPAEDAEAGSVLGAENVLDFDGDASSVPALDMFLEFPADPEAFDFVEGAEGVGVASDGTFTMTVEPETGWIRCGTVMPEFPGEPGYDDGATSIGWADEVLYDEVILPDPGDGGYVEGPPDDADGPPADVGDPAGGYDGYPSDDPTGGEPEVFICVFDVVPYDGGEPGDDPAGDDAAAVGEDMPPWSVDDLLFA